MTLSALPKAWFSELERFRLQSRRAYRPNMSGGHLMRRRGQSLEFRDFAAYTPGDDVRHIDWRASARSGQEDHLLIRQFAAEESMTLVISLDNRDTMRLPQDLPKLQVACWIAESLARIALGGSDRVILHPLFGRAGEIATFRGSNAIGRIAPTLEHLCREEAMLTQPNLAVLERHLPPTSVWLVMSDFYFDLERYGRPLVRQLAAARDGLRWVMLLDLDTWPLEKVLLGHGARRIEGPGSPRENRFDIDSESLRQVEVTMSDQKRVFRDLFQGQVPDWSHWLWPEQVEQEAFTFFQRRFGDDALLRRLFMRAS